MNTAKPFPISKRQVWEAYQRVKANQGGAGVDGETLKGFDEDLSNNLYKLWNRLASGSYFPPPVKRVEIPKANGDIRPLGVPTVADRIAQMVAKQVLEPELEKFFHPDSYGYRPGQSAHQALGRARRRCWDYDWVVELDIKGFFDNLDQALLMKAVRHHRPEPWVVLYVERWLSAPVQLPDGTLQVRTKGTPQGGVISPLLANLYLHYAFDRWMRAQHPGVPFERYADDAVCHCRNREEAERLKDALKRRFAEVGLELHPEKTRIVYCKDDDRRGEYPTTGFDFLGFTFQARRSKNRWGEYPTTGFDFLGFTFQARRSKNRWGKTFINFSPAVSRKAVKAVRQEVRRWKLHLRSDKSLEDLARMFNATIRGWMNYYAAYYLLQVGAVSDLEVHRSQTRAVGDAQVQEAAAAPSASRPLATPGGQAADGTLCTLAAVVWAGWIGRAG